MTDSRLDTTYPHMIDLPQDTEQRTQHMDTDSRTTTVAQATADMRLALDTYGLPLALCYVPIRVRKLIPPLALREMCDEIRNSINTPVTATALRSTIADWCDANPYTVVTTRSLSEIGGCSQGAARRFIAANPNYFKQIDQYKHEVRNYRADRAHDQATQ